VVCLAVSSERRSVQETFGIARILLLISSLFWDRIQSIVLAFCVVPTNKVWLYTFGILFLLILAMSPFVLRSSFLRFKPMVGSRWRIVATGLYLLIRPSLIEEFFFRVLMLPHPAQERPFWTTIIWVVISLATFVLWHPMNGMIFRTSARSLFTNPTFLAMAGLLGGACTAAYLISGSIWPPVLIHWILVTVWILLLGGREYLEGKTIA
jgi:predicted Abi (CAAX) family protease